MTTNEMNYLSKLYNTFMMVNTSGENTIIMGKCLESFKDFLLNTPIKEEININTEEG